MILVLADDLTSALDGAAPFAEHGLRARVLLDRDASEGAGAEVDALDLDTRFAEPDRAYARFVKVAGRAGASTIVYKTVDSTLRGNVAAEVAGALDGAGRTRALFAPAFPAGGRTTVDGRQLLDGMPLERTVFARDVRNPVLTGSIAALFDGAADRIDIRDARSDADLDAIVAGEPRTEEVLWVGSPGLAGALARKLGKGQAPAARAGAPAGRVLVVVGSLHPANADQIDELQRAGTPVVRLTEDEGDDDDAARAARHGLQTERTTCLVSPRVADTRAPDAAERMTRRLGAVAAAIAEDYDGLVVTGGDTARRVVDALRARSIELSGQVLPGVPYGTLVLTDGEIGFAAKAGGFGDRTALGQCVRLLGGAMAMSDHG